MTANDDEIARWSAEQARRFRRWQEGGKLQDADDVEVEISTTPAPTHQRRLDLDARDVEDEEGAP